ncbi:MAG: nucleotidyltransferase domain-containing protein [Bacteroidales bacterium]|jgi:predicted nucleotidyltransferase|nr:nucleotidyltransferase domain-containing protein [Bacteroidales bacterium]
MTSESQSLSIIKSVSNQIFPGCKVILFGSRARKDHQHFSDFDILLIVDQNLTPIEKIPFRNKIRKELLQYRILSDILIQSSEEVEIKRQLTGHIIKTIIYEGIVI